MLKYTEFNTNHNMFIRLDALLSKVSGDSLHRGKWHSIKTRYLYIYLVKDTRSAMRKYNHTQHYVGRLECTEITCQERYDSLRTSDNLQYFILFISF